MTLNYDNAVTLLARIEIENINGRWDQSEWAAMDATDMDLIIDEKTNLPIGFGTCGSGMCAAGWACTLAGIRLRWEAIDDDYFRADYTVDGTWVPRAAQAWLGLPERAEYGDDRWDHSHGWPILFSAENSLDDLYFHVATWMDEDEDEDGPARVARLRADVSARVIQMQKEAISQQRA